MAMRQLLPAMLMSLRRPTGEACVLCNNGRYVLPCEGRISAAVAGAHSRLAARPCVPAPKLGTGRCLVMLVSCPLLTCRGLGLLTRRPDTAAGRGRTAGMGGRSAGVCASLRRCQQWGRRCQPATAASSNPRCGSLPALICCALRTARHAQGSRRAQRSCRQLAVAQ